MLDAFQVYCDYDDGSCATCIDVREQVYTFAMQLLFIVLLSILSSLQQLKNLEEVDVSDESFWSVSGLLGKQVYSEPFIRNEATSSFKLLLLSSRMRSVRCS